jgi:hypothetical protein
MKGDAMFESLRILASKGSGNLHTILWIIAAVLVIAGIAPSLGEPSSPGSPLSSLDPRGTRWGEHLHLAKDGTRKKPLTKFI